MASRLPDEKRAAIVAAIQAGGTCRGIAREHKVSHAIVSRFAKEEGLSFERRAQTAAATEAATFDARATRAKLIERSYTEAAYFLDRMHQPYTMVVSSSAGAQFVTLAEPPLQEQRHAMTSYGIALDKALVLEKHDSGVGLEQVVSLLDTLQISLGVKHGTGDDEHPVNDDTASEP